ncbi:MAG TPA: ABC transporter permease, partial [Baekduia sp.]|nr:ABC transporter permease [Baekduia sp.]
MSTVPIDLATAPVPSRARTRLAAARELPGGVKWGGGIVVVVLLIAILAPVLAPQPNAGSISERLWDIGTAGHPLGTDGQGRDILSRLMWGARPTLVAGIVPVVVAGLIGTALGLLAGLARPWVRSAVMRTLDVVYAFPAILLAIAIGAALG